MTPTDPSSIETMAPGDWPAAPERRFAERQADLARECGLEVASRVVETDAAGRVHFLEAGDPDGDPVLLLHGITEPAATWLPMAPALAGDYRLVAPDMPGEGLSAKPTDRGRDLRAAATAYLADLLDALGLDRVDVVGHSLGGWQAFLCALDRDRAARLCLVGAPIGVSRDFPLLPRLMTVRGLNRLLFGLMRAGDPVAVAEDWVARVGVVDDSAVPESYYELYASRFGLPGLSTSLRSLMTGASSFGRMRPLVDLRDEIATIDRPTSFVWGTEDYYWPPAVGRVVAERMPDAAFHELAGHGHAPWLEPGDAAETRVRAFLDG
ncbi:MAG: alpha/beta fold hydrolase [Halobacteriales archaeon]